MQHNLILHLPITPEQIEQYMRQQRPVYKYCPTITAPKPVGAEFGKESDVHPTPYEGISRYKTVLTKQLNQEDKMVCKDNTPANDVSNIFPIHLDWGKTTNLHCWWCCYPFTNEPCHIINRDKLEGCFCSPNCTLSFINVERSNDRWRLTASLRQQYPKISDAGCLIPAPPRQCLKIFGGNLTITEFRSSFNVPRNDEYLYFQHPYRPSLTFVVKKNNNTNKVGKDDLVLRRTRKKFHNKNSLEITMGLTNE